MRSRPDGSLELFLPAAGSYGAPQTVKIGYEPIRMNVKVGWNGHPVLSDAAWRWQAMSRLGFAHNGASDTPYPETLYADRIRRQDDADWAFVLYVVDSLHDKDGMFRNKVVAYTADLFGPYSMLTYDNDGYGFANFDAVLAHEMGHVFGALDEYAPPTPGYPSTGDLTSGYLGVRNGNAVSGRHDATMPASCADRDETLNAFASGALCPSTIGPDRTARQRRRFPAGRGRHAAGFSTRLESTDASGAVTLRGTVAERPRHRGRISGGVYFRHDLSIKVPHDVQYRVDGGAWQPLTAADGAFDEPSEGWTLTTEPLAQGHHGLELEGTTGETAGRSRDLWAGPTPVDAGARHGRRLHQEVGRGRGRLAGAALRAQHRDGHDLPHRPPGAAQARPARRRQGHEHADDRRERRLDRSAAAGAHAHLRGALRRRSASS